MVVLVGLRGVSRKHLISLLWLVVTSLKQKRMLVIELMPIVVAIVINVHGVFSKLGRPDYSAIILYSHLRLN